MPKRRSKAAAETPPVQTKSAEAWTQGQKITAGVLAVVLFFMDFSIRVRAAINKSVDFQVAIKMAVWALAALWIALSFKKHVLPMLNRVSGPWLLLFVWLATTALYSPSPALTAVSGLSLILMTLTWLGASHSLGERRLVEVMFWAMVGFCVASLVLYFINPYLAQSSVRINGQRILTGRLQGLTGQANALGRTAGFACLLGALYFDVLRRRLGWYVLAPLAIAAVTLLLTQSRTSALAFVAASLVFYSLRSGKKWLAPLVLVAGSLIALIILPNFERFAISIARSGDPTEIYTATNRIYIWHLVTWMVQQKPILGWGYNTAASYFASYSKQVSPELGSYVPPNAHNAYLEVAFAGGSIALLLFLAAAVVNLWILFKHKHQRGMALMLFWFITSFTEVAGFTGVVSTSTITMILPMALAALAESRSAPGRKSRRSSSGARSSSSGRRSSSSKRGGKPTSEAPSAPGAGLTAVVTSLDDEPPPPSGAAALKGTVEVEDLG